MREILIIVAALLVNLNLLAQNGNSSFLLADWNSLQGSEVRKIYQTSQGAIWIGTRSDGIFRYRNESIEKVVPESGNLLSGFISIIEDAEGVLWLGGRGLMKYGLDEFTLIQGGPTSTVFFSMEEDELGNLYFGGNRGYDIYTREKSWITAAESLRGKVVHDIIVRDNKDVILATRKSGLIYLSEGSEIEYHLPGINCRKLFELSDGTVLISTNEGVFRMSKNQEIERLISGKILFPEFEDREGNIWFSSEADGIYKYDGIDWWNNTGAELKTRVVFTMIEVGNEQLLIGTNEGIKRLGKSRISWKKL